uniref:ShKT domain-containing protein n=1 Tax=Magallana gigas TaxID=29159 RepID=A0A8W8K282_MAGGI
MFTGGVHQWNSSHTRTYHQIKHPIQVEHYPPALCPTSTISKWYLSTGYHGNIQPAYLIPEEPIHHTDTIPSGTYPTGVTVPYTPTTGNLPTRLLYSTTVHKPQTNPITTTNLCPGGPSNKESPGRAGLTWSVSGRIGTTGFYRCVTTGCPTYSILPAACHLQKTPGSCCQTPSCEFDQQQGSYTGYGFTSGEGTAQNVVAPQPCVDVATNCKVYGKSVCTTYGQWASNNCRKYCGICQNTVIQPAAGDVCIYKGKTYLQGQSWEPDCSTRCTCENAHYGYYRCNDACPSYNNLPAGCKRDQQERRVLPCRQLQSGVFYTSSENINSIGNGG